MMHMPVSVLTSTPYVLTNENSQWNVSIVYLREYFIKSKPIQSTLTDNNILSTQTFTDNTFHYISIPKLNYLHGKIQN